METALKMAAMSLIPTQLCVIFFMLLFAHEISEHLRNIYALNFLLMHLENGGNKEKEVHGLRSWSG